MFDRNDDDILLFMHGIGDSMYVVFIVVYQINIVWSQ